MERRLSGSETGGKRANMPIARVFPRRTNATPPKSDEYAFVGDIPLFLPPDITEVHVSVAFSWDLQEAARLADAWSRVAPVKLGGPATGERGHDFIPGMYLKKGCVITSRGCPNHCWFCSVPEREGPLRELPVTEGNNVLDDNLLACSEQHIYKVFDMLDKQTNVILSGGLEAARLRPWHVALFERVHVKEAFFAYDGPDKWEPLVDAAQILKASDWYRPYKVCSYILCGYPGDTIAAAEKRCLDTLRLGIYPFAMFYRDVSGRQTKDKDWTKFQITWTRPAAINATRRRLGLKEVI